MINVICKKKKDIISYIEIKGHSEANKKGHDLICAGVTSIVLGSLKALESVDEKDVKINDGHVIIDIRNKITKEDNIRLKMMITQLELIANNYPKNVKIKKEK